jgi:hypothetical protein
LYHLAANPEYAIALREEVSVLVAEHGWTKEAVDRMYKIDSFLRESLRLSPGGSSEFDCLVSPATSFLFVLIIALQ